MSGFDQDNVGPISNAPPGKMPGALRLPGLQQCYLKAIGANGEEKQFSCRSSRLSGAGFLLL
ncbi:hypothetical protein CJP72_08385 [Citrobacter sp. NCU1]|nr:hypothetical protein [Citrobacter sp. NCU1]